MAEPSGKGPSNLVVRVATSAFMVPVLLWLLLLAPKWGFLTLVYAAVVVAASELMAMTQKGERALQAWGVAATLGLVTVALFVSTGAALLTSVVVLVIVGMLFGLARPEPAERAGTRLAWLLAGPLYVSLLAPIALLHQLPNGGAWVILSMMLAWFGDTGAYFAGRAFGKHKLYESVSPKKTVEGSIGGLLGSVAGATLASLWYLPALPLGHAIPLALVAGVAGQSGDLCESLIKRSVGVKDSGWIVPGHGGILDRVDALMFTGAVTWVYATWALYR